jgi:hypothetical protein
MVAPFIMAGVQAAGQVMDFIGKQQQMGIERDKVAEAKRAQGVQEFLTQLSMDRQYNLSTAGQKDVYGNQVVYDRNTNSWVTLTSPEGQALINRGEAITRNADVRNLGQGEAERNEGRTRRLAEGGAAQSLLTQMANRYGAPTREGTEGAERVAAATAATQPSMDAKSGFAAAALRSGGTVPLEGTLASADRQGAASLRTALAKNYRPIADEAMAGYNANKLNPYNTLATRASNVGDIPFAPSAIPGTLGSDLTARAGRAAATATPPYLGATLNQSSKNLLDAIGAQKVPDYGKMGGAFGKSIYDLGIDQGWWGGKSGDNTKFSGTIGDATRAYM